MQKPNLFRHMVKYGVGYGMIVSAPFLFVGAVNDESLLALLGSLLITLIFTILVGVVLGGGYGVITGIAICLFVRCLSPPPESREAIRVYEHRMYRAIVLIATISSGMWAFDGYEKAQSSSYLREKWHVAPLEEVIFVIVILSLPMLFAARRYVFRLLEPWEKPKGKPKPKNED